ncbi:MAG TPA: hypothetical protein VIY48_17725 [Candidatus Paceibacterota bacterium]
MIESDTELVDKAEGQAVRSLAALVDAFEAYSTAKEAAMAIMAELEQMDLAQTRATLVLAAQKLHELLPAIEASNEDCHTREAVEDV